MSNSRTGPNNSRPNDSGDGTARTIAYSYGDDYVINSAASAGAWIAATHTLLDIDQISAQEVSA